MPRLIVRRDVLVRTAAALVALTPPLLDTLPTAAKSKKPNKKPKQPKKQGKLKAYRLVTGRRANGGCSCRACQSHATNKVFASQKAVVRAHPGCNCEVTTISLPRGTWIKLFGQTNRPTTTVVDKRDPRVGQLLRGL